MCLSGNMSIKHPKTPHTFLGSRSLPLVATAMVMAKADAIPHAAQTSVRCLIGQSFPIPDLSQRFGAGLYKGKKTTVNLQWLRLEGAIGMELTSNTWWGLLLPNNLMRSDLAFAVMKPVVERPQETLFFRKDLDRQSKQSFCRVISYPILYNS